MRPAPDVYVPQYQIDAATKIDYLVLEIGRVWRFFVPFNLGQIYSSNHVIVAHWTCQTLTDACLTLILWLLALSVLPGRASRWFMISVSVLWTLAVLATVHIPLRSHCIFLNFNFMIALMFDSREGRGRSWMPAYAAQPVLMVLLSMQVSTCFYYCAAECINPFSTAHSTALWIEDNGLANRPLVVQPEVAAPAVLAYANIGSAYFPNCRCRGSFLVYRAGWEDRRLVTLEELQALQRQFGSPPLVISQWEIAKESLPRLGLQALYVSRRKDLFVYGTDYGMNSEIPAVTQ